MRLTKFLKDKVHLIILFFFFYLIFLLLFFALKIPTYFVISFSLLWALFLIIMFLTEFLRKKKFYDELKKNISKLDKAYLVLETLQKPEFYEGILLWDALYDINKSMNEKMNELENQTKNFKDYIEMWIHEVKKPISSLTLIAHNNQEKLDQNITSQIKRIESSVEQVLYYARCENASVDYLIKEVDIGKIIHEVALKNKDDLLINNITFQVENLHCFVLTDSKWLSFILEQLLQNSIKYRRENMESIIKISVVEEEKNTQIIVEDNGLGILPEDIPRVFDKTFTGHNGRKCKTSTGMGLFIVKNLCEKLGHKIEITSKVNEGTRVIITFFKNKHYEVIRK